MTRDELMALRKIAEAATLGPWHQGENAIDGSLAIRCEGRVYATTNVVARPTAPRDAAHIAAFNPQTTIRLIDQLLAREDP